MKKIVLSMALCVVLFGAVTTVTGCGKKPRNDALLQVKGTVWEETVVPPPPAQPDSPHKRYYCFHSDGRFYMAEEERDGDKLVLKAKDDMGTYSVDSKNITIGTTSTAYELKGDELTLKNGPGFTVKKVSVPTEDKIKGLKDK